MQYLKILKFLYFELLRILKWVTKGECVTSRVRKDARGYCKLKKNLIIFVLGQASTNFSLWEKHDQKNMSMRPAMDFLS